MPKIFTTGKLSLIICVFTKYCIFELPFILVFKKFSSQKNFIFLKMAKKPLQQIFVEKKNFWNYEIAQKQQMRWKMVNILFNKETDKHFWWLLNIF